MGKRIAVYILFALTTGYLFVMYDTSVLSVALVLEFLYPLASAIYLHLVCRSLTAELGSLPETGEKNQKMRIGLWIRNKSLVWNGKYELLLQIGLQGKTRQAKKRVSGMAEAHSNQETFFYFTSSYCGRVEISLKKMKVYDLPGFFYRTIPLAEKKTIGILPKLELMPLEITRRTREFPADADEHAAERSGDDPAEIYQVREYRALDSAHDIHWKLSAKEDRFMVKEYGFPLGCTVLLWLDLSKENQSSTGLDQMLERAACLSFTLVLEKCIHMAAWFDEKNERVIKRKIDSEEAVYEFIYHMLDMEPYGSRDIMKVYYEHAFWGDHFSSIVVIDGAGKIRVNGEEQDVLLL
ncbi:DUF58 domain-containing protein [Muricomes intestini]|uniref:DUF58 domain-containing protein n=1 Tax=Muricomes intestini TaxID=1796634 RepID=UPI002FDFE138